MGSVCVGVCVQGKRERESIMYAVITLVVT